MLQYVELQGDKMKFYKNKPDRLNRISHVKLNRYLQLNIASILLIHNIPQRWFSRI